MYQHVRETIPEPRRLDQRDLLVAALQDEVQFLREALRLVLYTQSLSSEKLPSGQ